MSGHYPLQEETSYVSKDKPDCHSAAKNFVHFRVNFNRVNFNRVDFDRVDFDNNHLYLINVYPQYNIDIVDSDGTKDEHGGSAACQHGDTDAYQHGDTDSYQHGNYYFVNFKLVDSRTFNYHFTN